MYIKKLELENVGPLQDGEFTFPFNKAGQPKPVVLAGPNGSAKSIALSFVVNTLLSARQEVFEDTEVEAGKVYKYRSPSYIRTGQHYYFGRVTLEQDFELTEWQLDVTRKDFESSYSFTPVRKSWTSIPENEGNAFSTNFGARRDELERLLNTNCFLYFPPNRFEEPAWLNYDNLTARANFSQLKHISRYSNRRSIQYSSLALNKDWIMDVLFDRETYEKRIAPAVVQNHQPAIPVFMGYQGPSTTIYEQIIRLLRAVLREDGDLRLGIGPRQQRNISLMMRDELLLPNIFQLSTGQALVLDLGLSILRDADLCQGQISKLEDIRGLVVIDEIDLHLHVDFQYSILPNLLRLFPKVQFLTTSHSPLFLMGMKKLFGDDGFVVLSMPGLIPIESEAFAEFENAYSLYRQSTSYSMDINNAIRNAQKPAVFLEGSTDIRYLERAAELLKQQTLIQQVSLFDGQGFGSLDNVWKHFNTRLSDAIPRTVILIYDCDTGKSATDKGLMKRRVLAQTSESPVTKGIENLFDRICLARARNAKPEFFDVTPSFTKVVRGVNVVVPEGWEVNPAEKANLCSWLCENGMASDFAGFKQIFDILADAGKEQTGSQGL